MKKSWPYLLGAALAKIAFLMFYGVALMYLFPLSVKPFWKEMPEVEYHQALAATLLIHLLALLLTPTRQGNHDRD